VPIVPRFKYALSRFLVNNGIGVVLLSFVGFALLGGFLYAVTKSGGETFGDSAFKAYTLLNNVPGADATADESLAGKLVSQLMYTIHVATFAIIIGIVSDKISSSVDSLRTSNERVQEVGHTVIVNWGDFTRPMMRQLEAARLEGRLSGPVVVLSETDKGRMDEEITDELTRIRAGLNVLTRQGSPVELNAMDRVAAGTANRIIILPRTGDNEEQAAERLRDSTGLALRCSVASAPLPRSGPLLSSPPPKSMHRASSTKRTASARTRR